MSQKGSLRVHDQVQEPFALDVFGCQAGLAKEFIVPRSIAHFIHELHCHCCSHQHELKHRSQLCLLL
jgi:hypothetical protein